MNVLVLGGTRFLGRHLVTHLLQGGHQVTLFNRGHTPAAGLFELIAKQSQQQGQLVRWQGDRDGGLQALIAREGGQAADGAHFDAVVDTCGYVPRVVEQSCTALRHARRYLFVSSISAYAEPTAVGADESAALAPLANPASEDVAAHYGPLKAACEQVVQRQFGQRALIVRPGLIVGPHDASGRFTYWPRRLAAGGDVLAPGPKAAPIQLIDARDLAQWMVHLLAQGAHGAWNAVGPVQPMTMAGLLNLCQRTCKGITAAASRLRWIEAEHLLAEGVAPWTELPLWLGQEPTGLMQLSHAKALATGLHCRPLAQTIADTLAWSGRIGAGSADAATAPVPAGIGLTAEREADLLARLPASD